MTNEKEINEYKHVERIIENLNQHWHSIKLLLSYVSKPLTINDIGLKEVLLEITEKLKLYCLKAEKLDLVQINSEIKFTGKRLDGIEKLLSEIKENGLRKEVKLEFSCDGYELVKKPIGYLPTDGIEKPIESLQIIIDKLTMKEGHVLIHRLGLFGMKKQTFLPLVKS